MLLAFARKVSAEPGLSPTNQAPVAEPEIQNPHCRLRKRGCVPGRSPGQGEPWRAG